MLNGEHPAAELDHQRRRPVNRMIWKIRNLNARLPNMIYFVLALLSGAAKTRPSVKPDGPRSMIRTALRKTSWLAVAFSAFLASGQIFGQSAPPLLQDIQVLAQFKPNPTMPEEWCLAAALSAQFDRKDRPEVG